MNNEHYEGLNVYVYGQWKRFDTLDKKEHSLDVVEALSLYSRKKKTNKKHKTKNKNKKVSIVYLLIKQYPLGAFQFQTFCSSWAKMSK